jgi:hypothetical protein
MGQKKEPGSKKWPKWPSRAIKMMSDKNPSCEGSIFVPANKVNFKLVEPGKKKP